MPTIPHGDPMQSLLFLHFTDERVRHRGWELAPSHTAGRWWGHDLSAQPHVSPHYTCLPDRMGGLDPGVGLRGQQRQRLEQERGLQLSVGSGVLGRWEWAAREEGGRGTGSPEERRLSTLAQEGAGGWYSLTGPKAEFPPGRRTHPCSKNELQVF